MRTRIALTALLLTGLTYGPESLANPHEAFEATCHVCGRLQTVREGRRWGRAMHHQTLFDDNKALSNIYFDNDEYIAIKVSGTAGYSTNNKDVGWVIIYDPARAVVRSWTISAGLLDVSATFKGSATSGNTVRIVTIDRLGNRLWEEDVEKGAGPLWEYDPRYPDGLQYTRAESPFWDDPHTGLGHLILRVTVPVDGPQPPADCPATDVECRLEWAKDRGWPCVCNQPDQNLAICSPVIGGSGGGGNK